MRETQSTADHIEVVTRKLLETIGADTVAAAVPSTGGGPRVRCLAEIWRRVQVVSPTTVRYKPFHKQLSKPGFAEFFRRLLENALREFTAPVLAGVSVPLGMFRDIVIHDGSSFSIKEGLADCWPGRF